MSIDARIDKLFHIEDQQVGDKKLWSVEDRKVITLWQGEGQMRNGNLELPIPWKRDTVDNNISVTISRFNSLKSSLRKKDKVETYNTAVNNMIVKGYAEKIPEKEINCSGTHLVLTTSSSSKERWLNSYSI